MINDITRRYESEETYETRRFKRSLPDDLNDPIRSHRSEFTIQGLTRTYPS